MRGVDEQPHEGARRGAKPDDPSTTEGMEGQGCSHNNVVVPGSGVEGVLRDLAASTRRPRVLLGVTGSVAGIKASPIVGQLLRAGAAVVVIATKWGETFIQKADMYAAQRGASCTTPTASSTQTSHVQNVRQIEGCPLLTDDDEWSCWNKIGDPVLHIELRKWADVMVVAPLSANTLAKLATGICDNLVTSVARAWDFKKPFLVAPAMNTVMWNHPFTHPQLETLKTLGIQVIPPVSKMLACGEMGEGGLADISTIVAAILVAVTKSSL
ncbi:phosphopantothenoylcysteine decarboxylase [Pelomyxa schiedti]|nr:phosphopantothenoylcysteine decarboxylase [Pelomyxa schiedti]